MTDTVAKPAALSAFLSPPSRITAKGNATAPATLTPQEISQKVASMLKPGPPFYSTVSSADLIDNLSNGSIMRCDDDAPSQSSSSKGKTTKEWLKNALHGATTKTSTNDDSNTNGTDEQVWTGTGTVWSALEALPSGPAAWRIPTSGQPAIATASSNDDSEDDADDGLWSSIMFACDLEGKQVELTKSCVVPTHVLNANHYYAGNRAALFTHIGAGTTYKWDDFSSTVTATSSSSNPASMLSLYTFPSIETWSLPSWVPYFGGGASGDKDAKKPNGGDAGKPAPTPPQNPKGSKRVWVPSTTKVSVRASWWGYTIFLPKAVLPALEADVDQAEKIAKIVHTVLTTILDNASKLPLPAALQAAVLLLKAIAPATSYISTFIGWSWDEIKSFDKGQGVELSATWLLPVALIPHTWDAAVAPADQNKDGIPDGPPVKQPLPAAPTTPAPAEPATPSSPAPATPSTPEAPVEPTKPTAPSSPAPITSAPTEAAPAEPAEPSPSPAQDTPVDSAASSTPMPETATSEAEPAPEDNAVVEPAAPPLSEPTGTTDEHLIVSPPEEGNTTAETLADSPDVEDDPVTTGTVEEQSEDVPSAAAVESNAVEINAVEINAESEQEPELKVQEKAEEANEEQQVEQAPEEQEDDAAGPDGGAQEDTEKPEEQQIEQVLQNDEYAAVTGDEATELVGSAAVDDQKEVAAAAAAATETQPTEVVSSSASAASVSDTTTATTAAAAATTTSPVKTKSKTARKLFGKITNRA